MAEEVKKKAPAKPRKPRAPKAVQPVPEEVKPKIIEEEPEVTVEPEVEEPAAVAEPSSAVVEEPKSEWFEDVDVRIQAASTKLPEGSETFEEFTATLNNGAVEIKKLNPNLPDGKSKWIAQIPTKNGGAHVLFKGSYPKAHRAAENWNASRGIFKDVKQIRSK